MKGFNRFDKILYINLAHRADRNEELLAELGRLGVDRDKIVRIDAEYKVFNGHWGCTLSHLKLIEHAIEHDYGDILILEDDMMIDGDADDIDAIFNRLTDAQIDWDVFMFGGNVYRYRLTEFEQLFAAHMVTMTHAFAVKKHYFTTLRDFYKAAAQIIGQRVTREEAEMVAHDKLFGALMQRDRWFFSEMIAYQRGSFSDSYVRNCAVKPRRYFLTHEHCAGNVYMSHGDPFLE